MRKTGDYPYESIISQKVLHSNVGNSGSVTKAVGIIKYNVQITIKNGSLSSSTKGNRTKQFPCVKLLFF